MKNRSWERHEAQDRFFLLFWWVLGAFYGPQEANMAATGDPRWSPNRIKIKAKMEAKNRCVLDGHIRRFFQTLGPNLAPKWRQVGHRKRFVVKFNWKGRKPKTYLFFQNFNIFWFRVVQNWGKNPSKIDETTTSTWEGILASICLTFLMDFGRFWQASWEGKSSQDRSKKATKKRWKN